jgi:hypothetical protein
MIFWKMKEKKEENDERIDVKVCEIDELQGLLVKFYVNLKDLVVCWDR